MCRELGRDFSSTANDFRNSAILSRRRTVGRFAGLSVFMFFTLRPHYTLLQARRQGPGSRAASQPPRPAGPVSLQRAKGNAPGRA